MSSKTTPAPLSTAAGIWNPRPQASGANANDQDQPKRHEE